jgi:hypothetical protein
MVSINVQASESWSELIVFRIRPYGTYEEGGKTPETGMTMSVLPAFNSQRRHFAEEFKKAKPWARRSRKTNDAMAPGDRRPFEQYFAADSMIFDAKGRSMDKKAIQRDMRTTWTCTSSHLGIC